MEAPVALEMRDIHKSYGPVEVLRGVSFDLRPGEVHALMGENGAGKSTLMRIVTGAQPPSSGEMYVQGERVDLRSPADAYALGIAAIYQEPTLFPDLDVAENIYMEHQPIRGRTGHIEWGAMYRNAQTLIAELGVRLDPRAKIRGLSVADQQTVEICKALSARSRILLMDEPTASLSLREVQDLFRIVRQLRADGVAIVFISHRLDEVYEISDRITVLRDGAYVGTGTPQDLPQDRLIQMMVGRSLETLYPKEEASIGPVALKVENLRRVGVFRDISFELHRGEILGMAGLVGAGRSEVARAIFGIDSLDEGQIYLDGKAVRISSARDAVRRGIAYVPEDRQHQGLVLPMSISRNITLPILQQLTVAGWIKTDEEDKVAAEYGHRLEVRRVTSFRQAVRQLSGGNQQKVVLAKWLATQPSVIILDEPTRGIDVGTKSEVHRLVSMLAGQGLAILMISSDLPEVLGMSDRILVMREGRITGEFSRAEASQEKIMARAIGTRPEAEVVTADGAGPSSRPGDIDAFISTRGPREEA